MLQRSTVYQVFCPYRTCMLDTCRLFFRKTCKEIKNLLHWIFLKEFHCNNKNKGFTPSIKCDCKQAFKQSVTQRLYISYKNTEVIFLLHLITMFFYFTSRISWKTSFVDHNKMDKTNCGEVVSGVVMENTNNPMFLQHVGIQHMCSRSSVSILEAQLVLDEKGSAELQEVINTRVNNWMCCTGIEAYQGSCKNIRRGSRLTQMQEMRF